MMLSEGPEDWDERRGRNNKSQINTNTKNLRKNINKIAPSFHSLWLPAWPFHYATSISRSPLIKAARPCSNVKNHLIKAQTSHLRRPRIPVWIYDNVFRWFTGDIKSPSVQKLSVTSPASILTGTHRELDIAVIPLQFHKGRDPGLRRGTSGADWETPMICRRKM